jgi:hypothetical protein
LAELNGIRKLLDAFVAPKQAEADVEFVDQIPELDVCVRPQLVGDGRGAEAPCDLM